MMANMAVSKVILQVLHLSYDVASWIHCAMFLYTQHIRCSLDTIKYNKLTGTVLRMDNAQRDKHPLPDGPSVGRQRLRFKTTLLVG